MFERAMTSSVKQEIAATRARIESKDIDEVTGRREINKVYERILEPIRKKIQTRYCKRDKLVDGVRKTAIDENIELTIEMLKDEIRKIYSTAEGDGNKKIVKDLEAIPVTGFQWDEPSINAFGRVLLRTEGASDADLAEMVSQELQLGKLSALTAEDIASMKPVVEWEMRARALLSKLVVKNPKRSMKSLLEEVNRECPGPGGKETDMAWIKLWRARALCREEKQQEPSVIIARPASHFLSDDPPAALDFSHGRDVESLAAKFEDHYVSFGDLGASASSSSASQKPAAPKDDAPEAGKETAEQGYTRQHGTKEVVNWKNPALRQEIFELWSISLTMPGIRVTQSDIREELSARHPELKGKLNAVTLSKKLGDWRVEFQQRLSRMGGRGELPKPEIHSKALRAKLDKETKPKSKSKPQAKSDIDWDSLKSEIFELKVDGFLSSTEVVSKLKERHPDINGIGLRVLERQLCTAWGEEYADRLMAKVDFVPINSSLAEHKYSRIIINWDPLMPEIFELMKKQVPKKVILIVLLRRHSSKHPLFAKALTITRLNTIATNRRDAYAFWLGRQEGKVPKSGEVHPKDPLEEPPLVELSPPIRDGQGPKKRKPSYRTTDPSLEFEEGLTALKTKLAGLRLSSGKSSEQSNPPANEPEKPRRINLIPGSHPVVDRILADILECGQDLERTCVSIASELNAEHKHAMRKHGIQKLTGAVVSRKLRYMQKKGLTPEKIRIKDY